MPTAPSVRNAGTPVAGSSTKAFPSAPTCSAGDTLLAFIADYPTTSAEYTTDPNGTGWTVVAVAKNVVLSARLTVLKRTATSSDSGSSFTFNDLSGGGTGEAVIIAYQGAAGIDVSASLTGASIGIAPAVTTTRTNCLIVEGWTFGPTVAQTLTPAATNRVNAAGTTAHVPLAVSDQTQTSPGGTGTQTCTSTNSGNSAAVTVALYPNQAPNAPSVTTPAGGSTINRNVTQRFTVPFSDPDVGDSQSALDIRYSSDGGTTWTTVSATGPNNYIDLAASTLAAGSYQVQGRSHDSVGNVSPWGPSTFFTAANPPTGPTITDPVSGATLTSSTYLVTFSYPSLTQYQWQVLGDLSGAADPTNVINAGATVTDTASRSFTVTGLPNSTTVHIQVRVFDGGLWSAWADSSNPVNFEPPPVPSVDDTATNATASIAVAVINPAPGAGEVATVSNDIYRRKLGDTSGGIRVATQVAPNTTWTDYTPASGVDYAYQVAAIAGNGTISLSPWTTDDPGFYPSTVLYPSPTLLPGA